MYVLCSALVCCVASSGCAELLRCVVMRCMWWFEITQCASCSLVSHVCRGCMGVVCVCRLCIFVWGSRVSYVSSVCRVWVSSRVCQMCVCVCRKCFICHVRVCIVRGSCVVLFCVVRPVRRVRRASGTTCALCASRLSRVSCISCVACVMMEKECLRMVDKTLTLVLVEP